MSWWSSVVDSMERAGAGAAWAWGSASLSRMSMGVVTYTANTAFQILEQGLALRRAVPTLIYNPNAWKILQGMTYVAVYDVLPLLALHYANNTTQTYFREGHEEDDWLSLYSAFTSVLTLADYGVRAYTWRQGMQSFVRVTVLDALGPVAFNSNKETPPASMCAELECNYKRKVKGLGREPLVLLANDGLTAAISHTPMIGATAAYVMRVFFNGRYMTRLVTPERCERHKGMMPESVLALGLTYEASMMLLDTVLKSTVGMPPYLYHRTLKHLLLLLHVNVAAHMPIPLIEEQDAPLVLDPLNIYERVSRFLVDVIFSGLLKRIPIDFQPEKGVSPLITLSPFMRMGTKLLHSDLETEHAHIPGVFSSTLHTARLWVLPPIAHSTHHLINDPVVSMFWPALREGGIAAADLVLSVSTAKTVATLAWAPKSVAAAIHMKFGVPKKVTQFLLMLSQENDFLDLVGALKMWFERHNIACDVVLVEAKQHALFEERRPERLGKQEALAPTHSVADLTSSRALPEGAAVAAPEQLVRPMVLASADAADRLFTTRRRKSRTPELPPQPAPNYTGQSF